MKDPLVTVILVTYNSSDVIKRSLDSVLNASYTNKEVIVVDNNSTDETLKILSKYAGKIKVLSQQNNLGYAQGNNIGIKESRGKYIFILNPDTEVATDFLQPLVGDMEKNDKVGACQPLVYLLNDKSKINLTGKETNFLGFDWIRDYLSKSIPAEGEITSFSGCGILLRKSILERTKAFDPFYFMYFEDSDLSWRFRLFGYVIRFVPDSIIYHDYKYVPVENYQPLKQKLYYCERNRLITVLKNYKLKTLLIIAPALIFLEILMLGFALLNGWIIEKLKGYKSIIDLFPYIKKERAFVQKYRTVDDKEIVQSFVPGIVFERFDNIILRLIVNPILTLFWDIAKKII